MKNIYLITPSWLIKKKKDFTDGVRNLEKLGLKVLNKAYPEKLPSPEEKARQIHKAFLDKNIDIILAQRGGYSSMRVLPYIDFNLIKRNPKIIAGFSDLSTLLNTIYERTGQVTFHAPMVLNFSKTTNFTIKSFLNAINGFSQKNLFHKAPVRVYRHGKAQGILKGGNLITLTALIGTKWETKTDGCILFLEDVDEKLHGVDRCLTQWIMNGKFNRIKGLILGDFRGIDNKEVYKIITEQQKINFPIVHCPYIGHVKNKITLPVGAEVKLDTNRKSLVVIR